jgi:hypothetical protein
MLAGDAVAAAIAASQNSLRREMNCDAIGSLMAIPYGVRSKAAE